jgi:hypothetical protein
MAEHGEQELVVHDGSSAEDGKLQEAGDTHDRADGQLEQRAPNGVASGDIVVRALAQHDGDDLTSLRRRRCYPSPEWSA